MGVLGYTVVTLCGLGVFFAVLLYAVARRFRVYEDPRIDRVEKLLPGANCGGCGFAGCRALAERLVASDDMSGLLCPVSGAAGMQAIAALLGKSAPETEPQVAVVRCGGSCDRRARLNRYDGVASCAVESALYGGETGCAFGCLGEGDCVAVCSFGALRMDPDTGLPTVDASQCTACGACVKACPRSIIELRPRGVRDRRVYVGCVNRDRGAVARKSCSVACIGCGKCAKACPFGAVTVTSDLAYIDPHKCRLCLKCVVACPSGGIVAVNFPSSVVSRLGAPSVPADGTEPKTDAVC